MTAPEFEYSAITLHSDFKKSRLKYRVIYWLLEFFRIPIEKHIYTISNSTLYGPIGIHVEKYPSEILIINTTHVHPINTTKVQTNA